MILNISGRCDIVAFYTEWFLNRLKEGYIDVRNPFNPKLVSRINLEDVDLFYFCTKNPKPILDHLKEIDKKVYFHVTLTPYKKDIEPGVPEKRDIIESIKKLSTIIEKENLVVRYDPILISEEYSVEYHKKAFEKVSKLLNKPSLIAFEIGYLQANKLTNLANTLLKEYDVLIEKDLALKNRFMFLSKKKGY